MKRTILSLALFAAIGAAHADLSQASNENGGNVESVGSFGRDNAGALTSADWSETDPPFQETVSEAGKYPPGTIMSVDREPVLLPDYDPVESLVHAVRNTLGEDWYVGAGLAQVRTSWADLNTGSSRSASSTGYRIYLGRQLGRYIGIEGEYLGAGTQTWQPASAIPGKPVDAGLQLKPAHVGIFGTVRPVEPFELGRYAWVSPFVKVGAVYNLASAKASAIYTAPPVGPGIPASSPAQSQPGLAKRFTPALAIGLDLLPTAVLSHSPRLSFRVEYQYLGGQEARADSPPGPKLISTDSHVIGLSATYLFY